MSKTGSAPRSFFGSYNCGQLPHLPPHFLFGLPWAVVFFFVKAALPKKEGSWRSGLFPGVFS